MEIKEAMEILEKDIHTEVPKAAISARKHELLEDLCEMDAGNMSKMSSVMNRLIGAEQKERLKEHLRTENGRVPMSKMMIEIEEIFKNAKAGKNS